MMKWPVSMFVGFAVVVVLLIVGNLFPATGHSIDMLLGVGTFFAGQLYGGLHGAEPLILAIVIDSIVIGMVVRTFWIGYRKWSQSRSDPS